MSTFADHLSAQLAEHLKRRRVVVWFDERKEFEGFIAELRGSTPKAGTLVRVGGERAHLLVFGGSIWELRLRAEPLAAVTRPDPAVLIYLGGVRRDRQASPLLELEKAGGTIEWSLRSQARNALRQQLSDGVIDDLVGRDGLTYVDVVSLVDQSAAGDQASVVRSIFGEQRDSWEILAQWLASDALDKEIARRNAADELYRLIFAKTGLELPATTALPDARLRAARYVLVNEFRGDLTGEAPAVLAQIPAARSREEMEGCRRLCTQLRREHPEAYDRLARRIETEMGLASAGLDGAALGRLDTFPFEESVLLRHADAVLVAERTDDVRRLVTERASCFWLQRSLARQAQWNVCGILAELQAEIASVRGALAATPRNPSAWIQAYSDRWHRVDWLHRRLEQAFGELTEDPDVGNALHKIRADYESLLAAQNEAFTTILESAGWSIPAGLQQNRIFADHVEPLNDRTAYFLVDALRYEMGADLAQRLASARELRLTPAFVALPSITPVGMAALMPGAASAFDLAEANDSVAGKVDGQVLSSVNERMSLLEARVAHATNMTLGHLLEAKPSRLKKEIDGKRLVVVRSQEIDTLGEADDGLLARQSMETVVSNLERAIRKLAEHGIERFVVAADHGYLFAGERGDDMRIDVPTGRAASRHRRCWVGEGGNTPPATVRVPAARLGYTCPLDLVIPKGIAVFRVQGGLRYHHGGASLQEAVIPVLTFRLASPVAVQAESGISVTEVPTAITNRVFAVRICLQADLVSANTRKVRVFAELGGTVMAEAAMAQDAQLDTTTRVIALTAARPATVALLVSGNPQGKLRILVTDADSQAVLYRSGELPIHFGI